MVDMAPGTRPVGPRALTGPDQPHLGPHHPGRHLSSALRAHFPWVVPTLSLALLPHGCCITRLCPPSCPRTLGQGGLLVRQGLLRDFCEFFSFVALSCTWGSSTSPPRTEIKAPVKVAWKLKAETGFWPSRSPFVPSPVCCWVGHRLCSGFRAVCWKGNHVCVR